MDFSLLTFGELLHPLNGDLKNQIRNFKKQKTQILSAKYGIIFNQQYIYGRLKKWTQIKTPNWCCKIIVLADFSYLIS